MREFHEINAFFFSRIHVTGKNQEQILQLPIYHENSQVHVGFSCFLHESKTHEDLRSGG
jgi:uncharacterized membrane protein